MTIIELHNYCCANDSVLWWSMDCPIVHLCILLLLGITLTAWLLPRITSRNKICNKLVLLDDKIYKRLKPPFWKCLFNRHSAMREYFSKYLVGRAFIDDGLWPIFVDLIQYGGYTPPDVHIHEGNTFTAKISPDNWYECDEITVVWEQGKLGSNKIDEISRPHKYTKRQVFEYYQDIVGE